MCSDKYINMYIYIYCTCCLPVHLNPKTQLQLHYIESYPLYIHKYIVILLILLILNKILIKCINNKTNNNV